VVAGQRVAGRVLPAWHYGSADVFLEALGLAGAGDVLVIDNGGVLAAARQIGEVERDQARSSGEPRSRSSPGWSSRSSTGSRSAGSLTAIPTRPAPHSTAISRGSP
jgi:hypothetical protein